VRILYFTDPHFSAVTPFARLDDYMATTFNKLDEIRLIVKKEKCDAFFVSGDWYNLKSWHRNPYLLTNKLIDYFVSLVIPGFGIIGDHDLTDRNPGSIERQPLGTLVKAAKIKLLSKGEEVELEKGIFLTGSSKTDGYEEDLTNYLPKRPEGAKMLLHMVHGDLYPKAPVYEPWTSYASLKDSNADFTFRGHIHRNDGIVEVGKTKIVGIGSLTRGTFNTDSIDRRPSVAILDTSTKDLKVIELKSAPDSSKIFDFAKKESEEKAEYEMSRLSELIKVESSSIQLSGPDSVYALVKELQTIDAPTRETCLRLLDLAQENI
jgi:DNA repair exonuclease SbcCD nuclease subunit